MEQKKFSWFIILCGCVVSCTGILGILGHLTGYLLLASITSEYVPMAPVTAIGLTIIGPLLLFGKWYRGNRLYYVFAISVSILVLVYGILKLLGYLFNVDFTFDRVTFPSHEQLGNFPVTRMSLIASLLMILTGVVFLLRITGRSTMLNSDIVCIMGMIILVCGFIISLGYLLGTPFLYKGDVRPPAATSAIALLFLGAGIIAWSWKSSRILKPFTSNLAGPKLMRGILPGIVLAIVLQAFLQHNLEFNTPFGEVFLSAVLTVISILFATLFLVQMSKRIFSRADQAEIERERIARSLMESEERLELFFSQSLDGFFFMMLDKPVEWKEDTDKEMVIDYVFDHHRITKVNDAMLQQYRASRDQFLGRTPNDLFSHDLKEGRQVWRDFFDKGTLHVETDERRFDGTQMFVEGDYICMYDPEGRITGHFGIQRDVTERKLAEQKIIQYAEELKESNASKDRFFSIISHDLKSPFNAILGFSQEMVNVARTNNPELMERFASHIYSSARRTYELLENLLEWSKAQQGTISFSPGVVDLGELLLEKTERLRYGAVAKDISLDYTYVPGIHVMADREMLKSILRNLITNAIKFTNPGGNITLHAERKGEETEICVKDNGIGINEEDLRKLFRIGQTVTHPGTKKERGTGLGLILCKEFVEKNGGKIWVESEPGKGSRVTFTLRSCS